MTQALLEVADLHAGYGRAEVLTKHPVTPSEKEIFDNPPSRSAKLRAVEMK